MRFQWRAFAQGHPQWLALIVALKRARTKVGIALTVLCVGKGIYWNEPPFYLDEPNRWVGVGLVLILVGLGFRLMACGCIKKKEDLATTGVYSLCRHPLYLGSILLTYGFCVLLNDPENFIVATTYFILFYSLTIVWEEIRLAERYGHAHDEYARATPLLLPIGHYQANTFGWARAIHNGGASMVGVTLVLLIMVELMAKVMQQH